jgi:UDP-glucuronate 4-epimerase
MAYLRLISAALNSTSFKLNGDGSVKRDFTYIDDVVNRIVNLILHESFLPEILNIGGGNEVSILDLIDHVQVSTKSKIVIEVRDSDKLDIPLTRASRELIDKYSGISNFTPIETGIRDTIDWFVDASKKHATHKWFPSSL